MTSIELRRNVMVDTFRQYGSTGGLEAQIETGDTPVKNWKGVPGVDCPRAECVSGEQLADRETGR